MGADNPYRTLAHDAKVLADIGRRLYDQPTSVTVRLPASVAAKAVASWERDGSEELPTEETSQQIEIRHRAATLALIGLCIQNAGVQDGEDVVVEMPAWYVGLALEAADKDGLLQNLPAAAEDR